MPKKKCLVGEDLLAARADDLIPVVVALDLPDTGPLWAAIRRSWSAEDLDLAIVAFRDAGDSTAFHAVLVPPTKMPYRWWHSLENTWAAVRKYEVDYGEPVSVPGLSKHGLWGLMDAIVKIHGGMDGFRGTTRKATHAYEQFPDFASVAAVIRKKESELGRLPYQRELSEIPGFVVAMRRFGNYVGTCQKMGVILPDRQMRGCHVDADGIGRRSNLRAKEDKRRIRAGRPGEKTLRSNVEVEMLAISRKIGHVPSGPELEAMGRSALLNSIRQYHDGMKVFRPRLEALLATEGQDLPDRPAED